MDSANAPRGRSFISLASLITALLLPIDVLAENPTGVASVNNLTGAAPSAETPTGFMQSLVVTIDRETGRLRPATTEERTALAAAGDLSLGPSHEAIVVETRTDGSVSARLDTRYSGGSVSDTPVHLGASSPESAATITIVNKDPAGQGLNDPTPVAPVGGNPGTAIGQQRLNVLNEAARVWAEILPIYVEIRVDASFSTLSCSATGAVIGDGGPISLMADFPHALFPGTWFVLAEANQYAGQELNPGQSHMKVHFNNNLGRMGCLDGSPFYYGFDTKGPSGSINLLSTALYGLAHGLGFISVADSSTGKLCCGSSPRPDIFDAFVYDTTSGKSWNQMATDAERKASAVNTGNLVWSGPAANAAGTAYLSRKPALYVTAPPAAAGTMNVSTATFGAAITESGVSGTVVAAADPAESGGGLPTDACSPLTNAAAVAGAIALVDRGFTCTFVTKAQNVQAAGAIGLVVANNTSGVTDMSGNDPTITIPVVMVSQSDGAKLRASLPVDVRIALDQNRRRGMNAAGQLLLYAPNPVESGSSISHWDTSAFPNLLMEPSVNYDLPIGVDITPEALRDIGWFGALPPVAPTADFTFSPSNPVAGQAVQLTDTSTGSPTSWSWDFGDGYGSTAQNPAHAYATAAAFTVTLTASNAGGSSTATKTVTVASAGASTCVEDAATMCLIGGRYRIRSHWRNQYAGGAVSTLSKAKLTDATGAFWLYDPATYEYLIRFNTATDNGRAWISIPTFTDVEFWIDVMDTTSGQSKQYHSPPGNRTLIYDPAFFVFP